MELQTVANILVAASVAHGLHSLMEAMAVNNKVKRLAAYINKQTPPRIPQGIDTRLKALTLVYGLTVVLFAGAFLITQAIDPAVRTAMWFAIIVFGSIELINNFLLDHYHAEIEKVTNKFK